MHGCLIAVCHDAGWHPINRDTLTHIPATDTQANAQSNAKTTFMASQNNNDNVEAFWIQRLVGG
jgi:hypothetical protein